MTFVYQQTTRLYPHGYFNSLVVQAIGTTQLLGTLSHFIWHGLASSEHLKRVCENQCGTLPVVAHKHIPTDLIISSFLDSN